MAKAKYKKSSYFIFFIFGSLLLVLVTYSFSKDFIRNYKLDKEINAMETEITAMKQKNVKLADLIKYFDSDSYIEQKARLELGLMKPGEALAIAPKKTSDNSVEAPTPVAAIIANAPNLQKWWQYFFKNKK